MGDMKKGYVNDMYGSGDFDQIKIKYVVLYAIVKATMNRHKEWPKSNPRAHGAADRNRRPGATNIIKVTHTSIIEKSI
jgi:hypothetical protein